MSRKINSSKLHTDKSKTLLFLTQNTAVWNVSLTNHSSVSLNSFKRHLKGHPFAKSFIY